MKNKNFTNPDLEIMNKNFIDLDARKNKMKIENFHKPRCGYGINNKNFTDPNVRKNKMKNNYFTDLEWDEELWVLLGVIIKVKGMDKLNSLCRRLFVIFYHSLFFFFSYWPFIAGT